VYLGKEAGDLGMTWDDVTQSVVALLRDGRDEDAWAAIDQAAGRLETRWPAPTAGFREVGRELYWTHRALPEYVRVQREQIRRLEAEPGPERAIVVRLVGALYDLASFTWPGWGNDVRAEDVETGAEAADRALRLREDSAYSDLEFTVTPGMAHWVVGAHALVAGNFERARKELALSGDETLARGYLGLVDLAEAGDRGELDAVLGELAAKDDEDSAFYRDQLVAASDVLGRTA
jgi:hypothetical protein